VLRLVAAMSLAMLAPTAVAAAESPERAEYVTRLESVCKPGVEATQRAVRGLRSDIKAERLSVAARKLSSAARIFDGTVRSISPVPRPPLDGTQLAKWFDYLELQEAYLAKAAAALRAERIVGYQHNAVRFVHTGNLANDVVIAFGFNYCRFKFSRFG
jgi:nucleotide-binding universal stress UspA family protein